MKNYKDTISTICGIVFAICSSLIIAINSGLTLPSWIVGTCGALIAVSGAMIGIMTGKTPNLTSKSESQVEVLNAEGKK